MAASSEELQRPADGAKRGRVLRETVVPGETQAAETSEAETGEPEGSGQEEQPA